MRILNVYNNIMDIRLFCSAYSLMKAPSITTVIDGKNKTLYMPVRWYICSFVSRHLNSIDVFKDFRCSGESNKAQS